MKILVLNAGSSSQKSRLYEVEGLLPASAPEPLWEANADWSKRQGFIELRVEARGETFEEELPAESRADVMEHMLKTLWSGKTQVIGQASEISIVGHRVVHGGREYEQSTFVTPEVKETIRKLAVIAPAHNPANLEGIEAIEKILPHVPQVAVFDTAFHHQIPLPAVVYPGPYEWFAEGIRRFGFHGLSYQYCTHRAAQILGQDDQSLRLIICHLGNGCSLAAIAGGHSIETTMGFTPMEGLMMGARSGTIDPGIILHLLRQKKYTVEELDTTLNKSSGLKGIAGVGDMRAVLQRMRAGDERAKLAFDMYIHRLRFYIGALLATLGGVDAFVFTGGVGENSADVRAAACETLGFLGMKLDEEKNAQSPTDEDIAAADSSVRVLVVQTQEDWVVAQECWKVTKK